MIKANIEKEERFQASNKVEKHTETDVENMQKTNLAYGLNWSSYSCQCFMVILSIGRHFGICFGPLLMNKTYQPFLNLII